MGPREEKKPRRRLARLGLFALGAVIAIVATTWFGLRLPDTHPPLFASGDTVAPAPDTGWDAWGATSGGVRFSSLDQINTGNIRYLQIAWTARTGDLGRYGVTHDNNSSFQATPILTPGAAGRSLVLCTPANRVLAFDPETGEVRWTFDPEIPLDDTSRYSCRGVAYWEDASVAEAAPCRHRIFTATQDLRVIALDARTGLRCADWADHGERRVQVEGRLDAPGEVQFKSPPTIVNGVVVIGSTIQDSLRTDGPRGTVHAFDAHNGALRWTFDPVPQDPGDPARVSWAGASADTTGGGNAWGTLAADAERDLIFIPTSSPQVDHYGGFRAGDNRHANSVVALRATTGDLVWAYQIIHHDLWDLDLAAQPVLIDLNVEGRVRPVVVQTTKMGLTFVFDRETGQPVLPVEERPVPTSGVEGEAPSPRQPFPTLTPALQAITIGPEDAWGLTPIDSTACRDRIEGATARGLYAPPTLEGTVSMPMPVGGVNWGGAAIDPKSSVMYVNSARVPGWLRLTRRENAAIQDSGMDANLGQFVMPMRGTPYVAELSLLASPLGLPCTAPPWGVLTALDLGQNRILWQVPFGTIAGQTGLGIELGLPSMGGPLITAGGIVFIGAAMDERVRAYDARDGRELWRRQLPAGGHSNPMTYAINGRQYLVIAAGGHFGLDTTRGDHLVAFALPRNMIEARSTNLP